MLTGLVSIEILYLHVEPEKQFQRCVLISSAQKKKKWSCDILGTEETKTKKTAKMPPLPWNPHFIMGGVTRKTET